MKKLKLRDWITEHGFSYRAAADVLGVDHGELHRVVNGMQLPGREFLTKIHSAGISVDEYLGGGK